MDYPLPPQVGTNHHLHLTPLVRITSLTLWLHRNELYGHVTSTRVQTAVFNVKWQEISAVLVALGLNPAEVAKLKAEPCGEDYINVGIEWAESDEEISSQLAELRKIQCEARKRQEEDHETIQDTR